MTPPLRDTALLLHGQPGTARDWDRVVDAIGPRATALAIDRPGWDRRSAATDLEGNARAALAALDAAGIARATVVGYSFGAAVAAWLAAHQPERVGALVLVAPSANMASLYDLDRWLAAPVVGDATSAFALTSLGATLMLAASRRRIARTLAMDERYLGAAGRRLLSPSTWRAFVSEQRVLVRDLPVLERWLPEIAAPTTIVAGKRDRVVPRRSVRQLAEQVPGAELRWLQGVGHLLPLWRAGALAEIIVQAGVAPPPDPLGGGGAAEPSKPEPGLR